MIQGFSVIKISKTQAGVKTKYINDVAFGLVQVLLETDNDGNTMATYTYGNDLISMTRISGISEICGYYHYDGLGSVKQLTDSSEAVVASYTYDGFGNLIASSGTTGNPYGFTGEQQFSEADGLVFLRARYYKPSIGKFVSRDPIGYEGGMNIYTYVKNNPILWRDPTGTKCCSSDEDAKNIEICLKQARADYQTCRDMAKYAYQAALDIIQMSDNNCRQNCEDSYRNIPGIYQSCLFGCKVAKGTALSAALAAYATADSGCALIYGMAVASCHGPICLMP